MTYMWDKMGDLKSAIKTEKYHKGDVKQDAVNIAFSIVQNEGGKKLTMRHLANELGVSHTALYRHYRNKDAVLLKVAAKGFKQLMLSMAKSLALPHKSSKEQLGDAAIAYISFAFEHSEIYSLMYGDFSVDQVSDVELLELSQKMFEILKIVIQKGQAESIFEVYDVEQFAFSLWSMVHGFVVLKLKQQSYKYDVAMSQQAISAIDKLISAYGIVS